MTQPEPSRTGRHADPGRPAAPSQGRHRVVHQPVPAPSMGQTPALPRWLPRTALAGLVALALAVGVLVTTSTAGTAKPPSRGGSPGTGALTGPARLSIGAPRGATLLTARPAHVSRPAAAGPAAVSGLAAHGIPVVALNAYRLAAARLATTQPACGLQWWLLAGIGRVESDHGRHGGATLTATGESRPHIIGPALDGTTNHTVYIADTDGGRLDGDPRVDHAVGPMQFIPSTWAIYGIDADRDGVANPFDLDDAALAAARYLCAAGGNLATAGGQRRAVLAYNHSDEYVALVLGIAAAYARDVPVTVPIRGVSTGALPPVRTGWLPPVNPGRPPAAGGSSSGIGSAGAGSSRNSGGSGSSSSGSSGSGSGSGSSGSGSGTGSSGTDSSGTGSSGTGSRPSGGSSSSSRPAPTSSAPARPVPLPSASQPGPSASQPPVGLPLPTGSNPVPLPTASVCTQVLLGITVPVPCTSS